MKVYQGNSRHSVPSDTIVNVSENSKPDQKIKPITKQSLLKRSIKTSAIASGFLLSIGGLLSYLAYLFSKNTEVCFNSNEDILGVCFNSECSNSMCNDASSIKIGLINKDTSFFNFLKIFGVSIKEFINFHRDPNYKSPYFSYADCSGDVLDNLDRLQRCSKSIENFSSTKETFLPEFTLLDGIFYAGIKEGFVMQEGFDYPALGILGLNKNDLQQMDRDTCINTIKKTYRQMTKEFHSDKIQDPTVSQYFPLLGEAKSTLAGSDYSVCGS